MALSHYEESVERGAPINLYTFNYGIGLNHRYTDHDVDVLWETNLYIALAAEEPQSIKSKGDLSTGKFELTVPKTSAIAELFRIYPPTQTVTLTRRQGHVANGDDPAAYATGVLFVVSWTGRVIDTQRGRNTVTLIGDSAAAAIGRPGLRRHYQRSCPHVLYGPYCMANKAAATYAAVVASFVGNQITLTSGWMPAGRTKADFETGTVEWTSGLGSEVRAILRMDSANILYTDAPLRGVAIGTAVNMVLKCARTLDDCRRLHNNVVNFGGQPYIPKINPVGKNNHT